MQRALHFHFSILLLSLFLISHIQIDAYPNGVSGYTLKTSNSGCGACHSTHSSPNLSVIVTIDGPATLRPSQSASYTATIQGGSGTKVGVDIAASNGTLLNDDNNLKVLNSELTQTTPRSFSGGQYIYHFTYTAPSDTGQQILYITGMSRKTQWNFGENFIVRVSVPFIAAPGDLTALFFSSPNRIQLNWVDNSNNETSFMIERKIEPNGDFNLIGSVGENVTEFTDTNNIVNSTDYVYRVYAVNDNTVSGFSNEASVSTPIPVELVSFSAERLDNNVLITWSTATETNNSHFEIKRNTPIYFPFEERTHQAIGVWKEIGRVDGHGTTTEPKSYSFTDNTVIGGAYNYRLKQIDFDGSFSYSPIIEVNLNLPSKFELYQNYPNPFNPSTVIEYSIPEESFVELKVYDVLGNEIAALVNEERSAGTYQANFNAENLSSGIYFYHILVDNFSSTKKMTVLK